MKARRKAGPVRVHLLCWGARTWEGPVATPDDRFAYYWLQAERMRDVARQMQHDAAMQGALKVAKSWEKLADSLKLDHPMIRGWVVNRGPASRN